LCPLGARDPLRDNHYHRSHSEDHIITMNSDVQDNIFLGDRSMWRYHRMSGRAPSVSFHERGVPIDPAHLGIELSRAGRHPRWAFAMPPGARRDPRHPDFSRVRPNSLVLTSESAIDHALDRAAEVYDIVENLPASPTRTSELGSLKKFTVLAGRYAPWYVQRLSGGSLSRPLPAVIQRIAHHVALVYQLHNPPSSPPSKADPSSTNAGWPTFVAHALGKIAGGLLTDKDFDVTYANAEAVAGALNLDGRTILGNGLGGRSGAVYKDTSLIAFTGTGWEELGTWKGYSQRNRIVHMSSYAVNQGIRPLFTYWHDSRKMIPGLWHSGGMDQAIIQGRKMTFESDISGFDVSVVRELQTLIAWHFAHVEPALAGPARFWLAAEALPMIGPSWDRSFDSCSVFTFLGGTRSGLKTTSESGTIYALIATLYALHQQGVNIWSWPRLKDMSLLIQGDDVLVATDVALDPAAWAASYADLGLTSELIEGDLFLSRHHDCVGAPYPSAGRIIQQTLSHEHEKTGDEETTKGLLALGLIARSEHTDRMPQEYRAIAGKSLEHASWLTKYCHAADFDDLAKIRNRLLSSSEVAHDISVALEAAEGATWIVEELREVEHSPSAQLLAKYISTKAPELLTESLNKDAAVAGIVAALSTLPRGQRVALAASYATLAMEDTAGADLELIRLITRFHETTTPKVT